MFLSTDENNGCDESSFNLDGSWIIQKYGPDPVYGSKFQGLNGTFIKIKRGTGTETSSFFFVSILSI